MKKKNPGAALMLTIYHYKQIIHTYTHTHSHTGTSLFFFFSFITTLTIAPNLPNPGNTQFHKGLV